MFPCLAQLRNYQVAVTLMLHHRCPHLALTTLGPRSIGGGHRVLTHFYRPMEDRRHFARKWGGTNCGSSFVFIDMIEQLSVRHLEFIFFYRDDQFICESFRVSNMR